MIDPDETLPDGFPAYVQTTVLSTLPPESGVTVDGDGTPLGSSGGWISPDGGTKFQVRVALKSYGDGELIGLYRSVVTCGVFRRTSPDLHARFIQGDQKLEESIEFWQWFASAASLAAVDAGARCRPPREAWGVDQGSVTRFTVLHLNDLANDPDIQPVETGTLQLHHLKKTGRTPDGFRPYSMTLTFPEHVYPPS